jgi:enoyl-CoA hydratase/carnithine racemase
MNSTLQRTERDGILLLTLNRPEARLVNQLQRALIGPVFTSADAREGAAAFAEKRKPAWTGK